MARQKQPNPVQRVVFSEYTSKADRTRRKPDTTTDDVTTKSNGHANGNVIQAISPKPKDEAGLLQLIMAVLGIYASL